MIYLASYDKYLQGLADTDSNLIGIGRVHLVCLPWLIAVVLVRPVFEMLGLGGVPGTVAGTAISIALLVGLFWSGFRYVSYRSRRRDAEQRSDQERGTNKLL